jgi:hypothetical protein
LRFAVVTSGWPTILDLSHRWLESKRRIQRLLRSPRYASILEVFYLTKFAAKPFVVDQGMIS